MNWKFIFPWRKINWHVLQIAKAKAHFRYTVFFMISEKNITRCTFLHHFYTSMHQKSQQGIPYKKNCVSEFQFLSNLKLPLCGLVVFIDMNMYLHTEGRDFKKSLTKNYAIALDSCYLFTKEIWNLQLSIILIVLMEFWYLRKSLQFNPCN